MRKLAITLAVSITLALAAVAYAALPQKGPFAGKTALRPINGFVDVVTFNAAPNGGSLRKFTFGTLGCFGHGSYPVGTDPYADPTNTALMKTVTVAANGSFSLKALATQSDVGQRDDHDLPDRQWRHLRAAEDEVQRHVRDAGQPRPQRRLTLTVPSIH